MDPKATLDRLCTAIEDHDIAEAKAAAMDLAIWLRRGGAMPPDTRATRASWEFVLCELADRL